MNYSELETAVEEIAEQTISTTQLATFTEQTEQRIYESVDLPVLRKTDTLSTAAGTQTVSVPADYLASYSLALVDGSGNYQYLVNKDDNFMQEAYPDPTSTAQPKYYANYNSTQFLLGPTPDAIYSLFLIYKYMPESIVTAGTTWLGDNFDSALLNGVLLEVARFMKAEEDIIANYEKLYLQSIKLLKQLGDGRLRQDMYRSGQFRQGVG